ncbi:MAG: DUF2333 family protein [Deltaproteobacteria bacterium]|jgi:hypothetical protein|nr:DUF2333 family protein [Deltaproteobacteria bacterium]
MAEPPQKTLIRAHAGKLILGAAAVLLVFVFTVMLANYRFPSFFEPSPAPRPGLTGWVFTETLIDVGDQMFDNWLPNDLLWPTVFLDNPQNFQMGELRMLNYTVLRLKDNLSRLRSSDNQDPDCTQAYTLLNNDPKKWIFPSAESRFRLAMEHLKKYRDNLEKNQARFSPRADNLTELLTDYVSQLGALNYELAQAPKELRLKSVYPAAPKSQVPAGESQPPAPAAAPPEAKAPVQTPYSRVDNNFYQAQGAAYVLRQMMAAIRIEFKDVLEVKKAGELADDIIQTLDQSQFEPWIVLNGDVGSLTANHSMELHSILENARQKIYNLIEMLSQ